METDGPRVDELRLQLYAELSDFRNLCARLGGRVSRCESELLELRLQVIDRKGARTPEFPSPLAVEGLPQLPKSPNSPAWNAVPEGPQLSPGSDWPKARPKEDVQAGRLRGVEHSIT